MTIDEIDYTITSSQNESGSESYPELHSRVLLRSNVNDQNRYVHFLVYVNLESVFGIEKFPEELQIEAVVLSEEGYDSVVKNRYPSFKSLASIQTSNSKQLQDAVTPFPITFVNVDEPIVDNSNYLPEIINRIAQDYFDKHSQRVNALLSSQNTMEFVWAKYNEIFMEGNAQPIENPTILRFFIPEFPVDKLDLLYLHCTQALSTSNKTIYNFVFTQV